MLTGVGSWFPDPPSSPPGDMEAHLNELKRKFQIPSDDADFMAFFRANKIQQAPPIMLASQDLAEEAELNDRRRCLISTRNTMGYQP